MKIIKFTIVLTVIIKCYLPATVLASSLFNGSDLIDINRDIDGIISLRGPSCQELIKQVQALKAWKISLGEVPGPMAAPVDLAEENRCQVIINNSVPNILKYLQGYKTVFNGPNCWNSALNLSGLIHFARYLSPDEMTFWLRSPYCRELSESERTLPGDIVEIRNLKPENSLAFEEIHGMIYLTDELVFSKNTSSHMSPYGIQRSSLVYQSFRVDDPKCRKIQGQKNNCIKWANHYRCRSADDDRSLFEKENNEFGDLFFELRKIEATISAYVSEGRGTFESNKIEIKNSLSNSERIILERKTNERGLGFFWQALLQEINSLKAQLEIITRQH